jgi:beta-lactamase regulating signal transducer with metallopeptidase domain/predicted  nucleic acid-binding Zn-ribbon protein
MIEMLEAVGGATYGIVVVAKATLLLSCAYVVTWAMRRRSAAARHAVWSAAVAGVVALPLVGLGSPPLPWAVPLPAWAVAGVADEAAPVAGVVVAEAAPPPVTPAGPGTEGILPASGAAAGAEAGPGHARGVAAGWSAVGAPSGGDGSLPVAWQVLLVMVWLAGVLAVLAYTLLSRVHVWLLGRRASELRDMRVLARAHGIASELGLRRPVEVLEGDADVMPMTWGVLGETLLLPASARSWSAERLDGVLRHELAHIRRRDSLTQLVAEVGCALYWFHPGMWLAARRLRVEREHACDDVVLLAGARPSDYAQELLEIARTMRAGSRAAHAALAMAQPSRLRGRLVAVLEERRRVAKLPVSVHVPLGAAALGLVLVLASITPSVASAAPPAEPAAEPQAPVPPADGFPSAEVAPPVASPVASPVAPPVASPVAPPVAPRGSQALECWGPFTGDGTMSRMAGAGAGAEQRERITQRTVNAIRLCLRLVGDVELDQTGASVRSMGPGSFVVLGARDAGRDLRLEITPGALGPEHAWFVDGEPRPFDADARAWSDAALAVLHGSGEIASIRGEVASLRGQIASVRGRRASLRGEMASIRGREASLRGEMASVRGRTAGLRGERASIRGHHASMRGEIASIRGRDAAMRGEIASLRGQMASLERSQRDATDPESRSRLEGEVDRLRASIRDVERRIEEYDAAGRAAKVERRIAEYDVAARTREIEQRIRAREVAAEAEMRAIEARAEVDTASRIAEVEARLAALDVDGEVARIEHRIQAVDADRRIDEIKARLEEHEQRLQESMRRIR